MRECGGDDIKGMVNGNEDVWSLGERDVEVHKGWDLCLCGGGGRSCGDVVVGGGVDCGDGGDGGGGGGVDGSGGNSGESGMCRSGGGSGNVVHRSVGGGLCSSG